MPNNLYENFEQKVLHYCQKPGRYIGNELLSEKKEWTGDKIKWGLFFPDIYDLGIANLGIITLYRILNKEKDVIAERFYMPAMDALKIMEKEGVPPLSLENKKEPKNFDIIGITLPYELTATNILKFLQLSKLGIYRNNDSFPLIIGGGAMAFNPLPLSPFFDAFVVGEGEDVVLHITNIFREKRNNKRDVLEALSKVEGIYVPSIHDTKKDKIKRLFVKDLNNYAPPLPIIPIVEATFDRLSLEVARGCTRGCRFCFAGMTGRPYRERNVDKISDFIKKALDKTGFDEFSPSSLSITDFSCFNNLFNTLFEISKDKKVALSLPSLRVGSIKNEVAEKIKTFRKTGFTIAPETYPSMQKALNKNIDFHDMAKDIETAFSLGWTNIKLYFMIGLPNETDDGLYEISDFIRYILRTSKSIRPHITLSFSNFVPKPHTPLQWSKMASINDLQRKQKILKDLFYPQKRIYLKLHNPYMSLLECIIARGDCDVAKAIEIAFSEGAVFDAWDDLFNFRIWENAFEKARVELQRYTSSFSMNERLPWDFIDTGIDKDFLVKEFNKYNTGVSTPDCRYDECSNCGICDFKSVAHVFSKQSDSSNNLIKILSEKFFRSYIIVYEKIGNMKYLGNLDILRLWHRILRISSIDLDYTKGHNPQPLIDGGWAIPLGMESFCEVLCFKGNLNNLENFMRNLEKNLPEGLKIIDFFEYSGRLSMDKFVSAAEYYCKVAPATHYTSLSYPFDNLMIKVVKKDGSIEVTSVSGKLLAFKLCEEGFLFTLKLEQGGLKPLDFAKAIVNKDVSPFNIEKIRIFCEGGLTFGKGVGC